MGRAETPLLAADRPTGQKRKPQRGIGIETRRHFKLEEYAGEGILYPFAKSKTGSKTAQSPGELSEKEEATWQARLTLNANGAKGGTAKERRAHAATHGVSDSAFDRAKNKLQELGKVNCGAPGKLGARFTPIL